MVQRLDPVVSVASNRQQDPRQLFAGAITANSTSFRRALRAQHTQRGALLSAPHAEVEASALVNGLDRSSDVGGEKSRIRRH